MSSGVAVRGRVHEHAPFVHKRSRSDRDPYVTIVSDDIMQDFILHQWFHIYAFSEAGGTTIIPQTDPDIPIGQRDETGAFDIHKTKCAV
ncbi:embryonic protein UVS.2-like [Hippocampus zosterae]|uniref:embryonic protein UVS.2-like n=1 Tax=Hippocampus zosterae TaxID=109293 RepID=UPI00223CFC4F|nr:embryonic protein UVS.2-like [Hippocampus zosterae]